MYEYHVLDSGVSYLIINDGWEYENPEIEAPQPINYTIDLHLLLLKRKISEDFSNFLKDILTRSGDKVVDRFVKWKVICCGHCLLTLCQILIKYQLLINIQVSTCLLMFFN